MIAWGGLGTMNSMPKLTVYRVNLDNGAGVAVDTANAQTRGFLLDERGATIARVDINEDKNRWRLYSYEDGKDRMILEQVSEMGMPLHDVRAAGRWAHRRHRSARRRQTRHVARDRSQDRRLDAGGRLAANAEAAMSAPIGDPWRHRVVGVGWTEDLPKQQFFDAELAKIYAAVQPLFDSGYVTLHSWSRDRARVLLFGEKAGDAGAYYLYDTGDPEAAHRSASAIRSSPRPSTWASVARSNTRHATARRFLPISRCRWESSRRNLPLVLLVHGGPHARDDFTFDWWASFLASRGYAVLQPNFRGSTGYGYEWFDAGRKGWGDGVMQTDVEDGAAALVKAGHVDAARICIMGGSYGGYAALAGATLTPERYACAVSVNGVSDPEDMLKDAQRGGRNQLGGGMVAQVHGRATWITCARYRRSGKPTRCESRSCCCMESKTASYPWSSRVP